MNLQQRIEAARKALEGGVLKVTQSCEEEVTVKADLCLTLEQAEALAWMQRTYKPNEESVLCVGAMMLMVRLRQRATTENTEDTEQG